MIDSNIINQFTTIAIIHLLGVMSPGPDFFLIIKQSLCHGRKVSLFTSIGIGAGIILHIIFCVFGLGIIISKSDIIFNLITIVGALYIIYIGFQSIRIKDSFIKINHPENKEYSPFSALTKGFFTNILNPKATLFFLSIYTIIISNNPSIYTQLAYGIWMAIATATWFSFLSIVLTNHHIAKKLVTLGSKIQKIMGVLLLIIGLNVIIANFRL